jgi:two-component system, NarL family, sensor histidine kinase DevS
MATDKGAELSFPDGPKLELDELIDQLVDRAQDVKKSQGRLRALLRAIETVTGNLSLETVLRNIAEAACELAGAKYAALGVVGSDGGLEQFITVGIDEQTAARIGDLPQGKGLLGALITDPAPIRLEHMVDDDRSAGFPPNHPPMDSFLGVPVRIRGEVYGNLYLTDSVNGRFSAEDEELVIALALAAGTAVSNARLFRESQLQQRWLTASVEIGSQLLAATGEDPLRMIARRAIDLADADVVSLGLLTPDGAGMVVEVAFGDGTDELIGRRFTLADTLAGRAVERREPLLLANPGEGDAPPSHLAAIIDPGPVMVLPLMSTDNVRGVLSLLRRRGRRAFTASELAMAAAFASHASVALELADSRTAEQRLVLLEDRDRIARDLHDHVIQELFAIGLGLESVAAVLGPGNAMGERVQQRVEDIDRTIRRIRTSIFALRGPLDMGKSGLRQRVLEIAGDLTPALGFPPHVSFAGVVDIVDDALADDAAACVREALTNVTKHAHATGATVDVSFVANELTVTITDNGVGYQSGGRSSGVANLQARAATHGGTCTIQPAPAGGTLVKWKALIA